VLVTKGPFKDNVGAVEIVNKKKRMAKIQLQGLNAAVNLPLDFLSPSKPIELKA
jgi:transcription antitermination factor NusG